MASTKEIVPSGTVLKMAKHNNKDYVLLPLGSAISTDPITPSPSQVWNVTLLVETEIEYDLSPVLKDAEGRTFADYIGGRPTR